MGDSDTEASTGTSPGQGRPRRNVSRPAHLSEEQAHDASLSGKRTRKTNPTKQINNQDNETRSNSSSSTRFLHLVLEKLDDQATAIQHLQQHAERREQEHQNQIALMQEQIKALTGTIESTQANYNDELKKMVGEIQTAISGSQLATPPVQSPSTGRSWASVVTPSSAISPATQMARTALGLPSIKINLRTATMETKQLLTDPTLTKTTINNELSKDQNTKQVQVEGVKSTPGNSLKVFVNSEEDARVLQQNQAWLEKLQGARLGQEPWYPIKIDDVRKIDVFENGELREDFKDMFQQENEAQAQRISWLSGPKPYGSMIAYLSKASDASRLLHRKMVQIRGEVSFTSEYQYQQRPMRCRNCQKYGHKEARCKNQTVCGRCAGSHKVIECTVAERKCGACGGGHEASYSGCSQWKDEITKLRNRNGAQVHGRNPGMTISNPN